MIPLPIPFKVSLLNAMKLLVNQPTPDQFKFVIVKDGVANVTNGKFYLRLDVAPLGYGDGYYHVWQEGVDFFLKPAVPQKSYSGVLNTGIDPEILRPDFSTLNPFCIIDHPGQVFLRILQEVVDIGIARDDKIVIEKKGIGLKRDGDTYIDFAFNASHTMYFDPRQIQVCFTDVIRHERIYLYQETGPVNDEGPLTPLIMGSGWRNCSIIFPIPDSYRSYYR